VRRELERHDTDDGREAVACEGDIGQEEEVWRCGTVMARTRRIPTARGASQWPDKCAFGSVKLLEIEIVCTPNLSGSHPL
jgi:hypothetical protein